MRAFIISLGLSLLLPACSRTTPPVDAPVAPVLEFAATDLAVAERRQYVPTLALSGTLRAWREATVKAKVAGELQLLNVREGDAVHAGQIIGRIETADYQARLSGLEADVAAAKANFAIAERNRETQESLLAKNFISRNAYDTTSANRDAAQARLDAALAAVLVGRKALADTALVAPIDGRVSARIVQPGERVPVDGRIVTISDVSRLELAASLPSADAAKLTIGAAVSLSVDGLADLALNGRVERINPAAAAGSRSIEVYALIQNPSGRLRGGLFAQGRVNAGEAREIVAVPASAVREEAGNKVVYVLAGEKLSRREVKAADTQDGLIAITQGVLVGEKVVRHNLGPMKEGAPVKVHPVPLAPTS